MKDNKSIGKKVWLLIENDNACTLDKSKIYTIVGVKDFKEAKDYCNHLILKSEDGEEIEVREYNAVFILKPELQGDEQIGRYLEDNGCYNDGVYTNSEGVTSVEISWGDWKHSFIWLDTLMGYIGYKFDNEEVTEENGSDCYSAIHYFSRVA